MSKEIPKPVKKLAYKKDLRKEYLNGWKKLFESIHEDIKVALYTQSDFENILRETLGDVNFPGYYFDDARIVVILPGELNLKYLVGLTGNLMFSHAEVLADPLIGENYNYDCEPEKSSWQKFYFDLCKISEENKGEIPLPPDLS